MGKTKYKRQKANKRKLYKTGPICIPKKAELYRIDKCQNKVLGCLVVKQNELKRDERGKEALKYWKLTKSCYGIGRK